MTISFRRGSACLNRDRRSAAWMDSSFAAAMKPQVLTMRMSASSGVVAMTAPASGQPSEDALRVHQVLRAAERDEVDARPGLHVPCNRVHHKFEFNTETQRARRGTEEAFEDSRILTLPPRFSMFSVPPSLKASLSPPADVEKVIRSESGNPPDDPTPQQSDPLHAAGPTLAPEMVRPPPARPAVAADERSVPRLGLGDHAATDAGGNGQAVFPPLPAPVPVRARAGRKRRPTR